MVNRVITPKQSLRQTTPQQRAVQQQQLRQVEDSLANSNSSNLAEAENRRLAIKKAISKGGFSLRNPALTKEDREQIRMIRALREEAQAFKDVEAQGGYDPSAVLEFNPKTGSYEQVLPLAEKKRREKQGVPSSIPGAKELLSTPRTEVISQAILDSRGQLPQKERFKLLTKRGDPNIGGAIRGVGQFAVGKIQKGVSKVSNLIPDKKKVIGVPERKFLPRGTAQINAMGGIVDETPFQTEQTINQFSLVKGLLNVKSPISGGDLALGTFFAPAFGFGTAAKSAYVQDQITGKFVLKSQAKQIGKQRIKEFQNLLSETKGVNRINFGKSSVDLTELTRKLIARNKDNVNNLRKLRNFYKRAGREDLFKDIFDQEIGSVVPKKSSTTINLAKSKQATPAQLPPSVPLRNAESSFAGRGAEFEKTQEVQYGGTTRLSSGNNLEGVRQNLNNQVNNFRAELLKSGFSLAEANVQANKQRSKLLQKYLQKQKSNQGQQEGQKFDQPQSQMPRLGQPTPSIPRLRTPQRQGDGVRQRTPQRPRIRQPPRLRFPIPFKTPSRSFSKRIKTLVSNKTPNKFDVFVRRKGKFIRVGKPIQDKKKAFDFLASKLDTTLRASGFIKPTRRKGLEKIPTSLSGYLSRTSKKFEFKRGLLVERRKFRLEKRGTEVREIKRERKTIFKKVKPFFFRRRK